MIIGDEEERPSTPEPNEICTTPNFSLRSIKKSHKKDKSKRKSCGYRSEDELSDTGSLFDYSTDDNSGEINKSATKSTVENNSSSTKSKENAVNKAAIHTPPINPIQNDDQPGPITPENRIDYLRRVMTDSIKKSHKKLKDSNKKTLFKSRIFEQQSDKMETNKTSDNDENRASTPDEKNSSRLLLAQFSSVKKSHKKDKHRKTGFAQRHIIMSQDDDSPSGSAREICHKSLLIPINIPSITVTESSVLSNTSDSLISPNSSTDSHYYSLGTSPLEKNENDSTSMMSSPNKRKNANGKHTSKAKMSSSNEGMDYVTAEEEFKIFTPIKKRKALTNIPTIQITSEESLLDDRCETPKLGIVILTPEKSILHEELQDDIVEEVAMSEEENENGRSTPENCGHLERISAFSSIKKSHKKDKWAKGKRRVIHSRKEIVESMEKEFSENNDGKFNSFEEPQPSTSYSEDKRMSISPITTPPNGLRAKTYLRLIQTTSIKRSHKKMREKRQRQMHSGGLELSDDGSLFNEVVKSTSLDESAILQKITEPDDNHEDIQPLIDIEVHYCVFTNVLFLI